MKNQELKFLTQGDNKVLAKFKKSVKLKKAGSNISPSNKDMLFDNLITIEELAGYIGVSQKTIRNWVAMRSIPFLRIGRKTFFYFEKIDKWFQTKVSKISCRKKAKLIHKASAKVIIKCLLTRLYLIG